MSSILLGVDCMKEYTSRLDSKNLPFAGTVHPVGMSSWQIPYDWPLWWSCRSWSVLLIVNYPYTPCIPSSFPPKYGPYNALCMQPSQTARGRCGISLEALSLAGLPLTDRASIWWRCDDITGAHGQPIFTRGIFRHGCINHHLEDLLSTNTNTY